MRLPAPCSGRHPMQNTCCAHETKGREPPQALPIFFPPRGSPPCLWEAFLPLQSAVVFAHFHSLGVKGSDAHLLVSYFSFTSYLDMRPWSLHLQVPTAQWEFPGSPTPRWCALRMKRCLQSTWHRAWPSALRKPSYCYFLCLCFLPKQTVNVVSPKHPPYCLAQKNV